MQVESINDPAIEEASSIVPKVSVCVVTYNQEKYIWQCLQNLVDQETSFKFEILVADDCSADGTREIVREFAKKYPGLFRLFLHEKNIGALENFKFIHEQTLGEYIAHMDGDDIALPGKLEAQAAYLDANPECAVVWHRMNIIDDDRTFCVPNVANVDAFKDGRVSLDDVLQFGSVSFHSSTMYRSAVRKTRSSMVDLIDWYYSVEYLRSGYGKYLNGIFGEYRYGNHSITRKADGENRVQAVLLANLEYYLDELPSYRKQIFIHALIAFAINMKNRRPISKGFGFLALKAITFVSPTELAAAFRRFRLINPPFRPQ